MPAPSRTAQTPGATRAAKELTALATEKPVATAAEVHAAAAAGDEVARRFSEFLKNKRYTGANFVVVGMAKRDAAVAMPRGMNLALGLERHLDDFTEALNNSGQQSVNVFGAYDRGYFAAMLNERAVVTSELTRISRLVIDNGGRLKFNVQGLVHGPTGITVAELEAILANSTLESSTDFYLGARELDGQELKGILRPWRK
jgi:hypothetical protein